MSNQFSNKRWAVVLLLILGIGSSQVRAQQDKMFSQYMFNMMALNPAYAGSRDVLSMSALYRNQWTGLPGAPQTATFTMDMPLNNERVGVGLQLYGDKIGVIQEAGAFASYAFRIKVGAKSTLALGLQAGASSYQANLTEVKTSPDNQLDPAFASNISKILPNFGTGIYLSNDRSYLSLSVPRLIKNKLSEYNVGDYRSVQARQAYLAAGFVVGLSPGIKMKPSMLVKYAEGAPLGFDGNINFWFADRISIGASIRRNQFSTWTKFTTDAVVGMLEVQLTDQFRFGYAYDHTMNGLQTVAPSSHEIMIRYEFGFGKNRILTPRYF
ncbi:type IX secretion system membrane protein PorP/SprF [Spirosoma sp. KCTC 42546]|uniref:PorP/SprF family type IX secretion system membrane protein n=1 Tax=Spirosoma sp. KCTC 42546 TaxID=2520506 RepID=UPI001158BF33|nr:type IX secretion system membrane protein PorP/SprF [Spirosoma sp. KCTC 42546]QDK81688.1 type IX secretion system membrane protein PorP/SprF [Spirosoma sp. KCTC 42546]